ncbi:TPA: hypothetical protein ACGO1T_001044 [Streptococcus suis]
MALVVLSKDLELVEVTYDGPKAQMIFYDEDNGIIRSVKFNKQSYDEATKKYIDDPEKAEKVETWCQEYFGLSFDELTGAIGQRKDVYVYDNFNSLFEVDQVDKFTADMLGDIFTTEIESIEDTGTKIAVRYRYDGKLLETKFRYADYVKALKKYLTDPKEKKIALEKFERKFKIPFEKKDELIGETIMVEVKKAGQWFWGEIKERKVK